MADIKGTTTVTAEIPAQSVDVNQAGPPKAADTTYQEDLTVAGQRKVNLIWEYTQSFVTVVVVLANMAVASYNGIKGVAISEHPAILSSSLFLILGFYYSRTNHTQIGGTGIKATDSQEYKGR